MPKVSNKCVMYGRASSLELDGCSIKKKVDLTVHNKHSSAERAAILSRSPTQQESQFAIRMQRMFEARLLFARRTCRRESRPSGSSRVRRAVPEFIKTNEEHGIPQVEIPLAFNFKMLLTALIKPILSSIQALQ